ncbi:Allergen [Penicillium pulvis]|uniref:Allergen n=1 Tax=Penicillium pulvis TaxID=1562058 RepID=UPI002547346F|nr:Allergen [Penicillium pulvis]KAJ5805530.1 Allergen [Penicillium pulvis]
MQFKDSLLLLTALSAGSAVARLHGHERRHAHAHIGDVAQEVEQEVPAPVVTPAAEMASELKARAVGDVVYATIDGVLESWINEWAGVVSSTSTSTSTSIYVAPTTTVQPTTTSTPAAVEPTTSAAASTSSSSSSSSGSSSGTWYETPSDGSYSRSGFGGSTASKSTGSLDWDYVGNVGSPWGSNIIQVAESEASQYKHVIRFEGSNSDDWSVVFWNTYGPSGKMDGFWSPNKALEFTLAPGEVAYVAIDDNSQGGWSAGQGSVPVSLIGEWAGTWGEFDMSSEKNDGFSGWDVSSIIAQLAGFDVQGMRICNHLGASCSSIATGLASLLNAYTSADQGNPSLAVSQAAGAVRLVVQLDWSE